MNTTITKIIEQYLENELSPQDKAAFEQRLSENPALRGELERLQQIREASKRAAVRTQVIKTGKRYHLLRKVWITGVVTAILLLSAFAYWQISAKEKSVFEGMNPDQLQQLYARLEKLAPLESLPVTFFNLEASDTVVLSETGVLLSVPEEAFLLDGKPYSGPKIVQWQEAIHAASIVKAGLSTVSGDRLLETQGMFGMQAFTPDGTQLEVNPKVGVYVQVPVDELKEGMQLFEGKRMQNGQIDWQNPQPLEKLPVMASMNELDFYPPGYAGKLDELKWKTGKKERDSLYGSFEYEERVEGENSPEVKPFTQKDSLGEEGSNIKVSGKQLFNMCATCHKAHQNSTGPKLFKVREKWANGGASPNSIYDWVVNSKETAEKDSYARRVSYYSPAIMSEYPNLKGRHDLIDAIFDYIDGQPYGIPPSKVLAFWKPEFNKTILATRDFEKRMQAIHRTCDKSVLETYVNQLNKPLWQIDAEVAAMGYGEFRTFAAERVGGIKLHNPHMNNLRQFYQRTLARLQKELKRDRNFVKNAEKKWEAHLQRLRTKEVDRRVRREAQNYEEEYALNMSSALQQLGYKKQSVGFTIRKGGKGTSGNPVVNMYNLDAFIANVTLNRSTGTFTDASTGKKATITYNRFSLQVEEYKRYEKLFVYLFPHEMNSFQRIDCINGVVDYPLNNGITYDMVVAGINEEGYYLYQKTGFNQGDLGLVSLESLSENAFNSRLETLNAGRQKKPLTIANELEWLLKEQQNYKVQRLRMEREAFRNTLRPIVFPCNCTDSISVVPAQVVEWEPATDEEQRIAM